jgi:hypothetical protein
MRKAGPRVSDLQALAIRASGHAGACLFGSLWRRLVPGSPWTWSAEPVLGDEFAAFPPVLDYGVLEPLLRQVGMVTDDDLELRCEFLGDIVEQPEKPVDGGAVGVVLGCPQPAARQPDEPASGGPRTSPSATRTDPSASAPSAQHVAYAALTDIQVAGQFPALGLRTGATAPTSAARSGSTYRYDHAPPTAACPATSPQPPARPIPVDLRDTATGLDQRNLRLLTAISHAAGQSPR